MGKIINGDGMYEITGLINLIDKPLVKSLSGRFSLTLNGLIYNQKTEDFLELVEKDGLKKALNKSKGMFSLALYDSKEQTLFLTRDRIGEKPLYHGFVNESFVFSSDLNKIKALKGFNNSINTDVLGLYFVHGYIPAPYSIYKGISKLDAGTILEIKAPFKEFKTYPYWSLKDVALNGQTNLFKGNRIEAADELERLLKEAIGGQMKADKPVGGFLSAGIDSTTIVALMQSLSTEKVKSFTIGMPSYANDEAIHAKKIASHLGLDHTEVYISEEETKAIIPLLSDVYGEPFADSSQIPTYLASKITREHVSISLTGDAGDELFCGYGSYLSIERAYRKLKRLPYMVRKPLSQLLLEGPIPLSKNNRIRAGLLKMNSATELYVNAIDCDPLFRKISLADVDIPYKYNEIEPNFLAEPIHQMMLMDMLMCVPYDMLVKVERAAAAVGLETRAPLLDKDIIEFAFSLPIDYKRNKNVGKLVLRDVLYRYVPQELMERPKQGFGIPIGKWLKEPELKSWAEQLISRDTLVRQGFLNPDVVHGIWNDFINNDRFIPQIWYILMFQSFIND